MILNIPRPKRVSANLTVCTPSWRGSEMGIGEGGGEVDGMDSCGFSGLAQIIQNRFSGSLG